MDGSVTNLDVKKVTVDLGGKYIKGFAADGVFSLTWNADRVTNVTGSQGDVVMVEGADESAVLVITVSSTSSSIPYLDDLCMERQSFPTTVNDSSKDAKMTFYSANCRVQKMADRSRNTGNPTMSYSIIMPHVTKV